MIANSYNIHMTYFHWKIIYYCRNYFFQYYIIPNLRNIITYLNTVIKKKIFNSIDIYLLFSKKIFFMISKISCLPKQVECF